jgi:hypothetical protein
MDRLFNAGRFRVQFDQSVENFAEILPWVRSFCFAVQNKVLPAFAGLSRIGRLDCHMGRIMGVGQVGSMLHFLSSAQSWSNISSLPPSRPIVRLAKNQQHAQFFSRSYVDNHVGLLDGHHWDLDCGAHGGIQFVDRLFGLWIGHSNYDVCIWSSAAVRRCLLFAFNYRQG